MTKSKRNTLTHRVNSQQIVNYMEKPIFISIFVYYVTKRAHSTCAINLFIVFFFFVLFVCFCCIFWFSHIRIDFYAVLFL